jgi:uncharacterized protein YegL
VDNNNEKVRKIQTTKTHKLSSLFRWVSQDHKLISPRKDFEILVQKSKTLNKRMILIS